MPYTLRTLPYLSLPDLAIGESTREELGAEAIRAAAPLDHQIYEQTLNAFDRQVARLTAIER